MTRSALYREPVSVNPALQRDKRVGQLTDFPVAKGLHAVSVAAAEFEHAALEYVIVFVPTGADSAAGKCRMAPIVPLGLHHGENLFVDRARWDARYLPAFIRRYPFWAADLPGGPAVAPNGSFAVDPEKLHALPDATVVELHRNGTLGLLQMHALSLANLRPPIDRKVSRLAAGPAASRRLNHER